MIAASISQNRSPNNISMRTWYLYVFELWLIFSVFSISGDLPGIGKFHEEHKYIIFNKHAFVFFAGPFIYGLRIAMFVAIFRKFKRPNPIELWIVKISVALFFLTLFGGYFLGGIWASANGYRECFKIEDRHPYYFFVPKDKSCPTAPSRDDFLNGYSVQEKYGPER
ncbi:hypothetical protein [Nitrospirillum iridis]|uniref:Uncharacterized protein n=1 Tax=Nitrospirillum iridis TaxID=765888 RepID=A0A7X0EDW6_9PROT|nr:hypothetical protein [Nitrospirillum iridis]MBB6253242.1 hypothetical protein [Nitrospirillum iridis]